MAEEIRNAAKVLVARIEALRLGQAWTIDELAGRAGMEPEYLERFLAETPDIGVSAILRLSTALKVDPEELLGGIEWVPDGCGGGEYRTDGPDR